MAAIRDIGGTIAQILEISSAIAAAVGELGATQVTGSIADVNRGAADTGSKAEQVRGRAVSLLAESNQLNIEAENFLHSRRASCRTARQRNPQSTR